MSRIVTFIYGALAYAATLAVFVYAFGFIGNVGVPKAYTKTGERGCIGQRSIDKRNDSTHSDLLPLGYNCAVRRLGRPCKTSR